MLKKLWSKGEENTRKLYENRFENILKLSESRLTEFQKNLDSIGNDHPDRQKARLDILSEISKVKQDIENNQKNLECAKEMPIIRSPKTPKDITDHNVWNDCWYDEKRKAFVTFNKYFEGATNSRTREIQIQYDKEVGSNSGIILEEGKIDFRFGHPVILQKDSENKDAWYLLPTLTDDMITDEIVTAKLRPTSPSNVALYRTQSEQWITVGTLGLKLCEKENEICDKLGVFPPVPLKELKALFGRV